MREKRGEWERERGRKTGRERGAKELLCYVMTFFSFLFFSS